ncbi:diguanylate cyclase [Sediminicurvatus halobius]|uniref:diguanylate cyclase n=1 Tax=Sediminicurvatus halobius TaxID=2182432 RepID=UPI001304F083|nr:diguanylate cyclase [Spiribacter halobius]UEX77822.1 diguanylate cyclase [Spiribacter halobius]
MSADWYTLSVLRDDGATQLLRVARRADPVTRRLVKRRAGAPAPEKAERLLHEHDLLSRHNLDCMLPLEGLAGSGQDAELHFRDPGGATLTGCGPQPVAGVLELALEITAVVAKLHDAGLLHGDLGPDAFLRAESGLYLTDLSQAVRLDRVASAPPLPAAVRLRYRAPELSGRLAQPADARADLYSLGALFYELLTGQAPFTAEPPDELLYQHLAVGAADPRSLVPDLPAPVAELVLRLLEKAPDARLPDAASLLEALSAVRRGAGHGTLHGASQQRPPASPQRLHGRDCERAVITAALERTRDHRPELLLVAGASGIGKTALIREVCQREGDARRLFVSGKFDQLQRGEPYSAWTAALEELMVLLLAEPAPALAVWRQRLTEALGSEAGRLAGLIPSLQALMGELAPPRPAPATETRAQLHDALLRLLAVFGAQDRPLVLFLDDLQWIDPASLELLETLVGKLDPAPVLIIGAYRDQAVDAAHPLMQTLVPLRQQRRLAVTEIDVGALDEQAVGGILSEAFGRPAAELADFTAEVQRRTGGNPFFLWQLLRTMHEHGWLGSDGAGGWRWDLEGLRDAGFADHVLALMAQRFEGLPEQTRALLSAAAGMGTVFEFDLLAGLAGEDAETLHRRLEPALRDAFILPLEVAGTGPHPARLRFVHDRMQEAAYAALSAAEAAALHERIGRLLLERLAPAERQARLLEIAAHLNLARGRLSSVAERLELARLDLQAARRAASAAAFPSAVDYLRQGMEALPADIWEREPALAADLWRERSELEYLNSEFETAERFLAEAIAREPDPVRAADLHHLRVVQCTLRARYGDAVAAAAEGLAPLGEHLPRADFEAARDAELAAVSERLGGRSLSVLGELPAMTEPRRQAVMKLLTTLGPACYRAHPRLWSVLVARSVRLSVEHGCVAAAGYAYPAYGGLLMHVGQGDGAGARALASATRRAMERLATPAERSVAHLMTGSSLRHWFAPLAEASRDYREAYRIGQASGNLQYAVYGFGHDTYCRFFAGEPLDELIPAVLGYLAYSRQRRNRWGVDLITGALRVFESLHGTWQHDDWPDRDDAEADYLARCEANGNLQVLCIYHVLRAAACLIRDDPAMAAASIAEAEARLPSISVQGLLPAALFPALRALAVVQAPEALGVEADTVEAELESAVARYAAWQRHAPENFRHWHQLLVAELARRRGDVSLLIDAYDAALQAARHQSCWPAVALIAARAASYWLQRDCPAFAEVYLEPRRLALRQGAAYALLAEDARGDVPVAGRGGERIDTVIRIAQALSLHTELSRLVPEIIRHVALQTGAQRVVLLLARGDGLQVSMDSGLQGARYYQRPPDLETVASLPQAVIRYVARSQRTLRFTAGDVSRTQLLAGDPYLGGGDGAGFRGTAWCVPLSYLGNLIGVLYLEHSLTTDAFDEGQAPLVEFLAAQAAISVRNIELINELAAEGEARREAELRTQTADAELAVRREMERHLQCLANTDALTGLANRRRFLEALEDAWRRRTEPTGPGAAVLMIDLDYFKDINDMYGHAAGDAVLQHIAAVLEETLRPVDLPARIGGEEFAVLLADGDAEAAMVIGERLCRALAATPARVAARQIVCTASLGVAALKRADASHEAVLNRADQALYRAKAAGRNRVCA